jgi:hypothetical protein
MSGRRDIQQAHERAQVAIFLEWLNARYGSKFEVVDEPNPPEAIVRSGRTTRWVEVTTAFWSDRYAQDEYSYATPGEVHKPIGNGPFVNPDAKFAARFVDVIRKKLEKASYLKSKEAYGPGYLLVPIMYPLFNSHSLGFMRKAWAKANLTNDRGCFRSVYLTHRAGRVLVQRWTEYRPRERVE